MRTFFCFILLACTSALALAAQGEEGLSFAGVPSLGYDADEGWGYGLVFQVTQFGKGKVQPYRWRTDGQLLFTQRGRKQLQFELDLPAISPHGRLQTELKLEDETAAPFYGVGPGTTFREALTDEDDPAFISETYYAFRLRQARLFAAYRHNWSPWFAVGATRLSYSEVDTASTASLLTEVAEGLAGRAGGWTNELRLAGGIDTRDDEVRPTSGMWSDLAVGQSSPLWGSDYTYTRAALRHRQYVPLSDRFVLAGRLAYQSIWGDVPFYEQTRIIAASELIGGVGGSESVRGIPQNRYRGPAAALATAELRSTLAELEVRDRTLWFGLNLFADAGRVWSDPLRFSLTDWHAGYGATVMTGLGRSIVLRVDLARSIVDPFAVYVSTGYLF